MRTIRYTSRFKKDFKREKSGLYAKRLDALLKDVVSMLATDTPLPQKFADHPLSGNWHEYRDCHVKPDLVLIYRKTDEDTLELVRLGSHSELGF